MNKIEIFEAAEQQFKAAAWGANYFPAAHEVTEFAERAVRIAELERSLAAAKAMQASALKRLVA